MKIEIEYFLDIGTEPKPIKLVLFSALRCTKSLRFHLQITNKYAYVVCIHNRGEVLKLHFRSIYVYIRLVKRSGRINQRNCYIASYCINSGFSVCLRYSSLCRFVNTRIHTCLMTYINVTNSNRYDFLHNN